MKTLIQNGILADVETGTATQSNLAIENGRILSLNADEAETYDEVIDAKGLWVMPGLIDVHTHGCAGADFTTATPDDLQRMQNFYLSHGVTSVMATLASAEVRDWENAVSTIQGQKQSLWCGIHFEGRYLNPEKRGAHALNLLASLDPREIDGILNSVTGAKHLTAAVELDDANMSFVKTALQHDATVAIGHTMATYDQAEKAFDSGVTAATHLYNAMPPLHHREGGVLASALMRPVFCELIVDGLHISPEVVRLTQQLKKDRLVLITDSMEGTGCADGIYHIAGEKVSLIQGEARTESGALAGSTLTLDEAVRNLVRFTGIPLMTAWYAASLAPAQEIKCDSEIGSLRPGKQADIVLIRPDEKAAFHIGPVFSKGRAVK